MSYDLYVFKSKKQLTEEEAANFVDEIFEDEDNEAKESEEIEEFIEKAFAEIPEDSGFWEEPLYEPYGELYIIYINPHLPEAKREQYLRILIRLLLEYEFYLYDPRTGSILSDPYNGQTPTPSGEPSRIFRDLLKGILLIALGVIFFIIAILLKGNA